MGQLNLYIYIYNLSTNVLGELKKITFLADMSKTPAKKM